MHSSEPFQIDGEVKTVGREFAICVSDANQMPVAMFHSMEDAIRAVACLNFLCGVPSCDIVRVVSAGIAAIEREGARSVRPRMDSMGITIQ